MNGTSTAREALIVEALGDVAQLLDRVESLRVSMEAERLALGNADARLGARLQAFDTGMSSITQQARIKTVEHIVRRANEVSRQSIEAQTRAMNEAARLAFTAQLDPVLARLAMATRHLIERTDRPWDVWFTHAATAASSAALTWILATGLGFR